MKALKYHQELLIASLLFSLLWCSAAAMAQELKPAVDSPQPPGQEFTVDIRAEGVTDLFGISFVLHYTHQADYIDVPSAGKGDFLGDDIIFLEPVRDDINGTVSIGLTRKRPAAGVSGSGVVARVTFKSLATTPDPTPVDLTLTNITANTADGTGITLTPVAHQVTIGNPVVHTLDITSSPTAVPSSLASSGGNVNLSVTAQDSLGHAITYAWNVTPNAGSFDNANQQNPIWTAPANSLAADAVYTLTVTATCSTDASLTDTASVQVTIRGASVGAVIRPVTGASQQAGSEFVVDITVEGVTDLFGISFLLRYTGTEYVDALSATRGDMLGNDVILLTPVIDNAGGTVSIGLTRKRPAAGVNGDGVVARVTFKSASDTPDGTSVGLSITDIAANDPDGNPVSLTPQPFTVTITRSEQQVTGDVSGDGSVSALDASLILQYVVGLIDQFPVDIMTVPDEHLADGTIVRVPEVRVREAERVRVPVRVDDMTGIIGGGVRLSYDANVLRAVDVTPTLTLSRAYWEANTDLDGEVRFAFVSAIPVMAHSGSDDGSTLFEVVFDVLPGNVGRESPLYLKSVELVGRQLSQVLNGSLTVLPTQTQLLQNYPNPFNPETWLPYQLSEDGEVTIRIFDIQGRLVRQFLLGKQPAGMYASRGRALHWDGRNNAGERVVSGMYFYQLMTPTFHQMRRMVIVK